MSSIDRTLDMVVVGLGGAGSRLAAEFHSRGYRALALSPSPAELDAVSSTAPDSAGPGLPKDKRILIGIEGHRGTGGEPEVGARCVRAHAQRIRDAVRAETPGTSGVLVIGGLGGGTGTALATLVDVLGDEVGPILAMATLPTQGENTVAKVHAARGARALTEARLGGLVFVDNARIADLHADLPLLDYHRRVNALIVDPLDALNTLAVRTELSAIRAIDRSSLKGLLFGGGLLTYGVSELDSFTADSVSNAVVDSLYASWLAASGLDPKAVSSLAIVIEAPDSLLRDVPVRVVEQLREQWKADTGGGSVELGVYRSSDAREGLVLRVLAACNELPARLTQLVSEAANEHRAMAEKRRRLPVLDVSELDGLDDAAARFSAVLSESTPARPWPILQERAEREESGLGRLPKAEPDQEATKRKRHDSAEIRKLPGRAAYARIVTRYRGTTDQALRQNIAERLEQDRLSQHAAVRYHAVDAMAKLGVPLFENALIAASEDPDPAVRTIASRALEDNRATGTAG